MSRIDAKRAKVSSNFDAAVIGASEGIRTLDIHLGKVTLYQTELRSLPTIGWQKLRESIWNASPVFASVIPIRFARSIFPSETRLG